MPKILLILLLVLFVLSNVSLAIHTAHFSILGGVRSGLCFGAQIEDKLINDSSYRIIAEFVSGRGPVFLYLGSKFLVMNFHEKNPIRFAMGLVNFSGNENRVGGSFSLILEDFIDIKPLFIEAGFDFIGAANIFIQLGYKI